MNLYAYCANNPVNWTDPWGLDKEGSDSNSGSGWPEGTGGVGVAVTIIGGGMIMLSTATGLGETGIAVLAGGGVGTVVVGVGLVIADAFGLDDVPGEMVDGVTDKLRDVDREWQYYEDNPEAFYDDMVR